MAASVGAATMTGGVAGFAAGMAWLPIGSDMPVPAAAALIAGAVVLDAAAARWRRLRALCLPYQVPRVWSAVFSPGVTAFLYGARLGVGPLTILTTWLWWAAIAIAAASGPLEAAAAGAAFGAVRLGSVVVASRAVEPSMTRRMHRLARAERLAAVAISTTALTLAGAALAVAAARETPDAPATRSTATALQENVPTPRSRPEPRPQAGEAADGPLATLLVDDIGPDLDPADAGRPGVGPLDLAEAAAVEDDSSAERALLETRGFEAGHARAWEGDDGRVVYVMAYAFAAADGAADYLTDGFITLAGRGARTYAVSGPPAARGFSQVDRRADGSLVAHGVAWARDSYFFLVFSAGPASVVTPDAAAAVAIAQDAHVCARSPGLCPGASSRCPTVWGHADDRLVEFDGARGCARETLPW